MLDLVRRIFPKTLAVFVDTGLEYPEIRNFVKSTPNVKCLYPKMPFYDVINQYGYPIVSKDVAHIIYYAKKGSNWAIKALQGLSTDGLYSKFAQKYIKYEYLLNAPFNISEKCCNIMKKRPINNFQKSSNLFSIIGTKTSESMRRKSAYLKVGCNAYTKKNPSSQPISFWTEQDILAYLKLTAIPYANIYGDIIHDEKNII